MCWKDIEKVPIVLDTDRNTIREYGPCLLLNPESDIILLNILFFPDSAHYRNMGKHGKAEAANYRVPICTWP